jgi:protein-S-isoprenylcysteine O-methyltransferase Ste14
MLALSLVTIMTAWVILVFIRVLQPQTQFRPLLGNIGLIDELAARIAGVALIVLGLVVYVSALVALGDSWRVGFDREKPGQLVTGGIYAISRNPIYVFFILYFIGTFLINGNLIFLIFTILIALNAHYLILEEEKFLPRVYGIAFRQYCQVTDRYFTRPRIYQSKM